MIGEVSKNLVDEIVGELTIVLAATNSFINPYMKPITAGTLTKNFSFNNSGYAVAKTRMVSVLAALTCGA
jgi:hypothetical protein